MLSKKDEVRLYAFVLAAPPEILLLRCWPDPFVAAPSATCPLDGSVCGGGGVSPMGEEDAIASFTRSSLLNFALADSKS